MRDLLSLKLTLEQVFCDGEGGGLLNYLALLVGQFYFGTHSVLKMQLCRIQTLEGSGTATM